MRNAGGTVNDIVITSPATDDGSVLTHTGVNGRGLVLRPTFRLSKGFEASLKFAVDYFKGKRTRKPTRSAIELTAVIIKRQRKSPPPNAMEIAPEQNTAISKREPYPYLSNSSLVQNEAQALCCFSFLVSL